MQTHKIAVFYLIGQFRDWWAEEFYTKQINLLYETGLYENIEFIDIHVAGGKQQLPFLPDKIRNITYHSNPLEEENETYKSIWDFCYKNPGYKILFFHSHGITHYNGDLVSNKINWKNYMEDCNIRLWRECTDLLNFYDCVGTDYRLYGSYQNQTMVIRAPHYPGMFWWANSSYIKKLDTGFMDQEVPWKRYLAELWIGSGDPKQYSINTTQTVNFYHDELSYDLIKIKEKAAARINYLRNESNLPPGEQNFDGE
jgi:hypothetical protein